MICPRKVRLRIAALHCRVYVSTTVLSMCVRIALQTNASPYETDKQPSYNVKPPAYFMALTKASLIPLKNGPNSLL